VSRRTGDPYLGVLSAVPVESGVQAQPMCGLDPAVGCDDERELPPTAERRAHGSGSRGARADSESGAVGACPLLCSGKIEDVQVSTSDGAFSLRHDDVQQLWNSG
jgi:hypothetical protein